MCLAMAVMGHLNSTSDRALLVGYLTTRKAELDRRTGLIQWPASNEAERKAETADLRLPAKVVQVRIC